jgi:hypothetical protein
MSFDMIIYHQQWNSRIARDDAVEGRRAPGEHAGDVKLHLLQGLGEQDVKSTSIVNEYLVILDPLTAGSRMSGKHHGSEKLVY